MQYIAFSILIMIVFLAIIVNRKAQPLVIFVVLYDMLLIFLYKLHKGDPYANTDNPIERSP